MERNCATGAPLAEVQVKPELMEVKIPLTPATAAIRLPSDEEVMLYQVLADWVIVHGEFTKLVKFPMMDWPAFCATFQPLAPAPEMRTMSPGFADAGSVTVTSCGLVNK